MLKYRHNYKYHAVLIILISVLFVLFFAGFNYIVDPLQIYRKQSFVAPRFYSDQRFQNAGKINSYLSSDKYETLIIGHSQVDNFIPSKVQNFLNSGKALKLTIDGSTPREQYLMVSKALEKGKINTVLWGVGLNFRESTPFRYNKNQFFPDYLYTESNFDDHPYLLSLDIFNFSVDLLRDKSAWETDLEMLNYWMPNQVKNYASFSSEKKLSDLQKQLEKSDVKCLKSMPEIQKISFPNIVTNLLPLIKKYPDVHFILFFPPHYYLELANFNNYFDLLSLQKSAVEDTALCPNVMVFGFDDSSAIGGNAANYRDMYHFHSGVNMYMLESIRNDRHRLTSLNFAEYETKVRNNLRDFRIYSNFETMIPMALPQENETLFATLRSNESKEMLDNAIILYKSNKFSAAVKILEAIINSTATDNITLLQNAHYYRGNAFMHMEKLDTAIHDYNKVVEINPDFAWAYIERGTAFLKLKNVDAAKKDFKHFITLKPNDFRGYWLLGNLSAKKGALRQAVALLTKAIELSPHDSPIALS